MKSILISIKPQYVSKILNGEKTIEVRRTAPKCKLPIDVYIYCTKGKKRLIDLRDDSFYYGISKRLNGKVVAKFTLNKVEEIEIVYSQENKFGGYSESYGTKTLSTDELLNKSQLDYFELAEYLKDYTPFGYAWHISNLVIFDKPKELKEFKQIKIYKGCIDCPLFGARCDEMEYIEVHKEGCYVPQNITSAPQSWMYIEGEE